MPKSARYAKAGGRFFLQQSSRFYERTLFTINALATILFSVLYNLAP